MLHSVAQSPVGLTSKEQRTELDGKSTEAAQTHRQRHTGTHSQLVFNI